MQAYLQHMQVLEQHRAVEAHQRMTAISRQQQQFGFASQPAAPANQVYNQMGHMTPSMRHSMGHITPSMGHQSSSLGHHSLGHTTPSMGNGNGYHSAGSSTPSVGHGMGHMTPSYPHAASVSYSGVSLSHALSLDHRFRFPSQAIVAQAGPNVVTWPHQVLRL